MQHAFPDDYGTRGCFLVPIDKSLLSIVAGELKYLEQRRAWKTDQDYEQGYNAIAELEACMTKLCTQELAEAQNRIYRLIDSTFNGVVYTNTGTPQAPVLTPPLPLVPTISPDTFITRLMAMENIRALNSYAVAYGETVPAGESTRELIKQLIAKIGAGEWTAEEKAQLLADIAELLLMLA